jgi:hypothetical protein
MAKKKVKVIEGFVLYDVIYEDGSKSSRRKVSAADVAEHGDTHAKTAIMEQDLRISEFSGQNRSPIRTISRSAS